METLIAKPNATAGIWKYFGLEPDENGKPKNLSEVICRLCGSKVPVQRGNTSNPKAHLRCNHPEKHREMTSSESTSSTSGRSGQRQLDVSEAYARVAKYNRESNKWRWLTDKVSYFLAEEMQAFRTVEKESFKEMLQAFDNQ